MESNALQGGPVLGVAGPVALGLTLSGVKGSKVLPLSSWNLFPGDHKAFDRDVVMIPGLLVQDLATSAPAMLPTAPRPDVEWRRLVAVALVLRPRCAPTGLATMAPRFHHGSNAPSCTRTHQGAESPGLLDSICGCVSLRPLASSPNGTFNQGVGGSIPPRLTICFG